MVAGLYFLSSVSLKILLGFYICASADILLSACVCVEMLNTQVEQAKVKENRGRYRSGVLFIGKLLITKVR